MSEAPKMAFAHMGIYVTDIVRMEDFYTRVLGFSVTDRAKIRGANVVFLSRNPDEHHQIVLVPGRDPAHPSTINQISIRVISLPELRRIHAQLVSEPVASRRNQHTDSSGIPLRDLQPGTCTRIFRRSYSQLFKSVTATGFFCVHIFSGAKILHLRRKVNIQHRRVKQRDRTNSRHTIDHVPPTLCHRQAKRINGSHACDYYLVHLTSQCEQIFRNAKTPKHRTGHARWTNIRFISLFRLSHHNKEVQRLYEEYLGKPLGERSHHLLHTHYAKRDVVL